MINIDEYRYLPDSMEQSEIEKQLIYILDGFSDVRNPEILECIWELLLRQGNNPGLLTDSVSQKLSNYLMFAWDKNSPETTDTCLSIAINMKLEEFYQYVLKESKSLSNNKVLNEIQNYIDEFGFSTR